MPILYIVGGVITTALFFYLFYAMLAPEKFS